MATSATVILVMVLLMMAIEIAMETRSSALAHQDYVLFSSLLIVFFLFFVFFCHKFTDARTLGNTFFFVFPAAEASIIVITLQEFRIYRP